MSSHSRRIVITGVTKGLGKALAEAFIAHGHQVIGCGRSEAAIARMRSEYPEGHDFAAVDVASREGVARWSERVLREFGAPDLLVNNAGVGGVRAPVWEVPASDFEQVLAVNVLGVLHVIQAFVPAMAEAGRGVIVNISSSWGREPAAGVGAYCASKFAVEGLTGSLALELPEGLAAVALDPGGGINTSMLQAGLGVRAEAFPSPQEWVKKAAPFILGIGPAENGKPLTVS